MKKRKTTTRTPSTASALPIGWQRSVSHKRSIGFNVDDGAPSADSQPTLIQYEGDSHLVTLGPTGSGKSRGCAIPALLSHAGPAIVIDVKGELYNTTARRRRELGQKVYKLDPWGVTKGKTDAFNPLDMLKLPGVDFEEEAHMLAKLLGADDSFERDKFWSHTSSAINAGLIAYLSSSVPEEDRRLSRARELMAGDFPYTLAALLDCNQVKSRLAADEFKIFLAHADNTTRPSVQSTAQQHFRLLGTDAVRRAMDTSTFSAQSLIDHEPVTIYLVIPPHKLASHGAILRVWLGSFLQILSRRTSRGQHRTLFLVDEAAALGAMEPLKQCITLLRGYGAQVWTFWQDVSQLQSLYPGDWQTIINNAGVVQLLSPRNYRMAEEYASLVGGLRAADLLSMPTDEQILITETHRDPIRSIRMDYLKDPQFKGLFDSNPMFAAEKPGPFGQKTIAGGAL